MPTRSLPVNGDNLFARTFAFYLGASALLIGVVSLFAAYQVGGTLWSERLLKLGNPDGPQVGLLIEMVRLFLVVVLGLATVCLGFADEVALLFRHRRRPVESGPVVSDTRRRFRRVSGEWRTLLGDRELLFRAILVLLVLALGGWKVAEVFRRGPANLPARMLHWGLAPGEGMWRVHSAEALQPVISEEDYSYRRLQEHFQEAQWASIVYLPYTLVNYGLVIPLVFLVPLYSALVTDRRKLKMRHFYRLLRGNAPTDELREELERIRGRCFSASQRYLFLCAGLGIVFVYIQFDPTLASGTRTGLKYVFYVLVGGSALAVIRLWAYYYAAWHSALAHFVERGDPTQAVDDRLSPLRLGRDLLVQTPPGIVAASLLTPTFQELVGRFLGS